MTNADGDIESVDKDAALPSNQATEIRVTVVIDSSQEEERKRQKREESFKVFCFIFVASVIIVVPVYLLMSLYQWIMG